MTFRFRSTVLLALMLFAALAAQAATTGALLGVVTDSTGAALPGVTVTVTGENLQGSRTAVTSSTGEYQLQLLPPGNYRVELTLEGFDAVSRENVKVALDTTSKLDVIMAVGAMTDAIVVTADAVVVDPTQTAVQQNFGQQHLKYATIGANGRSYQSVLQQAAGVAAVPGSSGNPSVMGANFGQNNYMLDGVNTTDPVTHTHGSNLPFDAIQEVSTQILGKDAEYGRAIGGVVNVVTKSGGNEFSGTFDARFGNDQLAESGEHFDADAQDFQSFKPGATLGGPVLRDRIWFFGTLERPDSKVTEGPTTYRPDFTIQPGTTAFQGWNSLFKLTLTPAANHTLSLRYTNNNATITNAIGTGIVSPEADYVQDQESTIYNAGYDAVLTPRWLASVQVGARRGWLESAPKQDVSLPSIYNQSYGYYTQNYLNWQYGNRNRDELLASTTYFADFAGSHTFKAGLNLDRATFTSFNNFTGIGAFDELCTEEFGFEGGTQCGGIYYHAGNDEKDLLIVTSVTPEETFRSNLSAYYVQDEWRPISSVTARLGLRYDRSTFEVADNENAPDMSKIQPRIGLAWDVFNNTRTVLHGFWGDVMDDNGLTLASFGSRLGTTLGFFLYNPHSDEYDIFAGSAGGASGNQYEPGLKPTVSREMNLGITQRVWRNSTFDLTGVWRESRDMFEDSCNDADCAFFVMTNRPNGLDVLKSEYQGVIAKLETRPFSWLSGLVSYTWSESKGSVEYTQNAGADFDEYPAHFANRYGYLTDDARHRFKAAGFVSTPFGTTFGVDYIYRSGVPDNVTTALTGAPGQPASGGTLYILPRGGRRLPSAQQLDLQVVHELTLGRVTVGLIGSVFNVFSSETVTDLGSNIGAYSACTTGTIVDARDAVQGDCVANPLFGQLTGAPAALSVTSSTYNQALDWQQPRRYEVGVRFEF
jgi:Carboxypeptidase regulatory-like domain/TonB dependent receptor